MRIAASGQGNRGFVWQAAAGWVTLLLHEACIMGMGLADAAVQADDS